MSEIVENPKLKSIYELLCNEEGKPESFFIPSYQRGYRWTEQQVKELLEDIWEFAQDVESNKNSGFYCLQPIVIKKSKEVDFTWDVIDGQQRLTTIYILLKYFEQQTKTKPYKIGYETRKNSQEFLKNIDNVPNENNIDFFHMSKTFATIEKWFEDKDFANINLFLTRLLQKPNIENNNIDKAKNIRVIWYEIEDKENNSLNAENIYKEDIEIFTRINMGKIPLTNAELIKALLIQGYKDNDNKNNKQFELASEWDFIEYSLQNDDFWYFINKEKNEKATRIEFIFELISKKYFEDNKEKFPELNDLDKSKSIDRYYEFHIINHYLKNGKSNENLWSEVKNYFRILNEWYEDKEFFHKIGFLVIYSEKTMLNFIDSYIVYGEIKGEGKNKKLTPLDGQQRLTTLFLLHWYLATKEDKLSKASEKLQKFTYETRVSSREFCKALTTNKIDFSKEDEKISNIIEDKNWFFKSWKKDPTIKSMLNMLDAIHEKFKNSDKLFDKLICEKNPPITFDFLPLNDFNLTDELYVKMNARGKPLTLFENFKAEFEKYIEDDEIKSKLDNDWLDIFWNKYKDNLKDKESETLKKIDESYLNFFNNITLFFAIKKKNENNEYEIIKSINEFDIFKYKYKSEEINHISSVFDKIKEEKFLIEFNNIRENLGVFDNFIKEYSAISYEERMIFYIYYKLSILEIFDDKSTKSIIRVCINIVNNTVYNTIDDFRNSINQIDILFEKHENINEFLNNYNPQHNISEQLKEEKEKAILILGNESWEKEILEAEKNWYLDGQIGFLLEFTDKKLEKFIEYRDKFINLWCLAKDDKKQNLIQRALLVKSDYTALNSRDYLGKYSLLSFGTRLREKNENWRRVFKEDFFKDFLDNLDDNDIENSLKEIINSFKFDCTDWRSFIINPDKEWHILDGIKNGHFLKKDNNIFLNYGGTDATSWGWSRVAELKNYYIYTYFINNGFEEVVGEKLKQKIKLEYYASSEPKDVCFYFIINYDKKDLGINIEFDTEKNKYIFDIFYRNPYKELQRLCLEFELCKDKLLNNLKDIQEEIVENLDNILFT